MTGKDILIAAFGNEVLSRSYLGKFLRLRLSYLRVLCKSRDLLPYQERKPRKHKSSSCVIHQVHLASIETGFELG